MTEQTTLPKVIYIMGTARSGTTILEVLLSYGKSTFGAGEISGLIHDGFIENKICSCKSEFKKCLVWGNVNKVLNLTNDQFKQWEFVQKKLDWHDGFLRQIFGLINKKEWQLYNEYNKNLLSVIKKISGAVTLVDSSKYVGRAYALSKSKNIDLRIICLTRSPEGLMTSFQKPNKEEQKPKSIISTVLYYCYTLLTLRMVSLLLGNKIFFLQYESLLKSPKKCIEKIEGFTNTDFSKTKKILEENKEFDVGHIVTGNLLRKNKVIRFDPKGSSISKFTLTQKTSIVFMNLWKWMFRF